MNRNNEISKSFNLNATNYDAAAKIQVEIGQRLLSRLDLLKISPHYILDLGCGTGFFSQELRKRYPRAVIISFDLAYTMLQQVKKRQKFWQRWPIVNGDMGLLPFADQSFDLIFANQVIHWSPSLVDLLAQCQRTLSDKGCLLFSTLGPDTFKEIRSTWHDKFAHTNEFMDMHDIGDNLLKAQFADPVVDMEFVTMHYRKLTSLLRDLRHQGVRNINDQRNPGLTGRRKWQKFTENYQKLTASDNKYPLTYEIIYGIAWKGMQKKADNSVHYIPITEIKRPKA